MTYDFKDYLIREMVERDHRPEERRLVGRRADSTVGLASGPEVVCSKDLEPWPCQAIGDLRAYWKAKHVELLGEDRWG
jgi:hypothetical protein